MGRYLLDTNHACRLLRPNSDLWLRIRLDPSSEHAVSLPTVGELWFMVFNSHRASENEHDLRGLLARLNILDFDLRAAIEFGRLRAELRREGRPIPGVDAQIAAIARLHDLTLLSADRHFAHVPGLSVENWLE